MTAPTLVLTVHEISSPALIHDCMDVMHAAFDPAFGEAWTADQTRSMLDLPGTFLVAGRIGDRIVGFSLVRAIVGEAELLLLAVDPAERRRGYGQAILARSIAHSVVCGASVMFLEVREGNEAIALYESMYFAQYSIRRDYYMGSDGKRRSALSLKRQIV